MCRSDVVVKIVMDIAALKTKAAGSGPALERWNEFGVDCFLLSVKHREETQ